MVVCSGLRVEIELGKSVFFCGIFIDKKKGVGFYGVARLVQQRLLHPL